MTQLMSHVTSQDPETMLLIIVENLRWRTKQFFKNRTERNDSKWFMFFRLTGNRF